MLKPNEVIRSAEIAAECMKTICTVAAGGGRTPTYRSPEQARLIVGLINFAVDAMIHGEDAAIPTDVSACETPAENPNPDAREALTRKEAEDFARSLARDIARSLGIKPEHVSCDVGFRKGDTKA